MARVAPHRPDRWETRRRGRLGHLGEGSHPRRREVSLGLSLPAPPRPPPGKRRRDGGDARTWMGSHAWSFGKRRCVVHDHRWRRHSAVACTWARRKRSNELFHRPSQRIVVEDMQEMQTIVPGSWNANGNGTSTSFGGCDFLGRSKAQFAGTKDAVEASDVSVRPSSVVSNVDVLETSRIDRIPTRRRYAGKDTCRGLALHLHLQLRPRSNFLVVLHHLVRMSSTIRCLHLASRSHRVGRGRVVSLPIPLVLGFPFDFAF